MGNNLILTIGIPTYNGSNTIEDMLDILLPQCTDEVEVLVSDNCSTDSTPDIIKVYQENYPSIKYVRNKTNLGADGNFLQCMQMARGKFTMLISDDDIICEGAVDKIIKYLRSHENVQLAYLDSVGFKSKYKGLAECHTYIQFSKQVVSDVFTQSKAEFLHYAQRLWGFTSAFVWNTERFHEINNPEQYFNTYFLQSYIHMHCADRGTDYLGVIKGPCIAIGEYGIIGNYDTAEVEGVFYRKMITEAVCCGFPLKQMEMYYRWKLRFLVPRAILKEKVAGVKKTEWRNVVLATKGLPFVRIYLLSIYLIPSGIARNILRVYRKKQGRSIETHVNRPTD